MRIGSLIAERMTAELQLAFPDTLGKDYEKTAGVVYGIFNKIGSKLLLNDWLSFPNGDTFTKDFDVSNKGGAITKIDNSFNKGEINV